VIELGCGSGHNLAALAARHDAAGIGVDHDPAKIRRPGGLLAITLRADDHHDTVIVLRRH
jgi:trans-aconitate methyltransferase